MKTLRAKRHTGGHPQALSLILVRHGPAQEREEFAKTGQADSLRPLTPKGMERTRLASASLAKLLGPVDYLITSPYVRAAQTADILAQSLTVQQHLKSEHLAPESDPAHQIGWLKAAGFSGIVVVVGHEPNLSEWIAWLLCPHAPVLVEMKKGAACALHFSEGLDQSQAQLLWLLTQPQLAALKC